MHAQGLGSEPQHVKAGCSSWVYLGHTQTTDSWPSSDLVVQWDPVSKNKGVVMKKTLKLANCVQNCAFICTWVHTCTNYEYVHRHRHIRSVLNITLWCHHLLAPIPCPFSTLPSWSTPHRQALHLVSHTFTPCPRLLLLLMKLGPLVVSGFLAPYYRSRVSQEEAQLCHW